MEPQDANTGFWVKDALYTFDPSTKIENAQRLYLIETENLKKLGACKNWASRYFGVYDEKKISVARDENGIQIHDSNVIVYRNGRAFYLYEGYPIEHPFSVTKPISDEERPEICSNLSSFNGVDYDMSSLICTRFSNEDMSWNDILELMERCKPTSQCDPCTKVGYKIAKSLIKIAALRIFADPEQSIMELPVNSLDAYVTMEGGSRRIGKFGMGFFSELYWLVGHPRRQIIIHSYSKDQDGRYCTYKIVIREINGILSFNLEMYPESQITTTGFRVLIDASNDEFSTENIRRFGEQLNKLKFASGAKIIRDVSLDSRSRGLPGNKTPVWWTIFENMGHTPPILNEGVISENDIICYVCPSFILVEDYATGVPPSVALGSLFVPSISTKTIQLSEDTIVPYENQSKYIPSKYRMGEPDRLMILVGGIAVVSIESAKIGGDYYVIHMPYNTRLPVSRDDIIFTSDTASIFKESIRKIFSQLLESEKADVSKFQELLIKYKEFTPNLENQTAVTQALNEFFESHKSRLIPVDYRELYQSINKRFIASQVYDAMEFERWLDANIPSLTNIWYGVKVVLIPGDVKDNIKDGGSINYLFISERYKQRLGRDWVKIISTSYFKIKLYPVDSSYGLKEYDKYSKIDLNNIDLNHGIVWILRRYILSGLISTNIMDIVTTKSQTREPTFISEIIEEKELLNYVYAILSKLESLSIYFIIDDNALKYTLFSLAGCYIFLKRSSFVAILGELMKKLSSFIGNQTYGASKNRLYSSFDVVEDLAKFFTDPAIPNAEKKEVFFTDHIIYGIRAIKELPITNLFIGTPNNPYSLNYTGSVDHIIGDTGYKRRYLPFPKEAWLQSSNIIEFTILLGGIGRSFREGFDHPLLPFFIAYNLENIRSKGYDASTLVSMYSVWDNLWFDTATHTTIFLKKDTLLAKQWVKNIKNISNISTIKRYMPPSKNLTTFKLGNMIRFLFEQDIPAASEVPAFLKTVSQIKKERGPLQIIEIAVNEGTVKSFIEATMTELFQNSVDAIREFKPENESVRILLQKTASGSGTDLVLSIGDFVGMSSDAFIYIGVPFLSTKEPSELVTGEMGSGFFNAYRESSTVLIDSTKDGVRRVSYDIPIRDSRGRVVDIQKIVSITKDKSRHNLTQISITIPTTSNLDEVTKVARIDYIARNILALALISEIVYNGQDIYIPKILGAKIGYFELYFTDPHKTVKHESYLLTKGIPFAPLVPYFKNLLSQRVLDIIDRNFVVNITHGGYTPVQTRTRINIPPEVAADFRQAAIYTVFITMVREVSGRHIRYALDHIDSTASALQLYFTIYNIGTESIELLDEGYFLKYTNFFGQPSIAKLINDCIDIMQENTYEERSEEIDRFLNTYSSPYPEIDKMVRKIVIDWLTPKNKGILRHVKEHTEDVPDEPDPEVEPIITAWIDTYWNLAVKGEIVGYKKDYNKMTNLEIRQTLSNLSLPTRGGRAEMIQRLKMSGKELKAPKGVAVYSANRQNLNGWYNNVQHTISINTYNWNDEDRDQILKVLKEGTVESIETTLKGNKTWDEVFGFRFPTATLPHEMEHARRGKTHEGGGHDSTYTALFPGDEYIVRTFDQAANAVFQKVLSDGFYNDFFNSLRRQR